MKVPIPGYGGLTRTICDNPKCRKPVVINWGRDKTRDCCCNECAQVDYTTIEKENVMTEETTAAASAVSPKSKAVKKATKNAPKKAAAKKATATKAAPKKAAAKKTTKKAAKKVAAAPVETPVKSNGRMTLSDDMKIVVQKEGNPFRAGTKNADRYELTAKCKTVGEFREKHNERQYVGSVAGLLQVAEDRGWITLS